MKNYLKSRKSEIHLKAYRVTTLTVMTPKPEIFEETSTEENTEEPQHVKQRKSAPWRRNADGTYNSKPSDPEYFKNYYRKKVMCRVQCEYCLKLIQKTKLQKHHNTLRCQAFQQRRVIGCPKNEAA